MTTLMLLLATTTTYADTKHANIKHTNYHNFTGGKKKKMHLCHNNRYNNKPHKANPERDAKHDLSGIQRR